MDAAAYMAWLPVEDGDHARAVSVVNALLDRGFEWGRAHECDAAQLGPAMARMHDAALAETVLADPEAVRMACAIAHAVATDAVFSYLDEDVRKVQVPGMAISCERSEDSVDVVLNADEEKAGFCAVRFAAVVSHALLAHYESNEAASFTWGGSMHGGAMFCTAAGIEVLSCEEWLFDRHRDWREQQAAPTTDAPTPDTGL